MAFSYGKKNLANTTLVSSLNSSATSVTVTDASIFPSSYFYATLMPSSEISSLSNSEIVMVTNVSGNVLTIIRAQRGTNARSFDAGAVITNGIYSQDLDMAQAVGKKIFTANWDSDAGYYKINDPMLKIVPDEGTSIRVVFDTDVSSGASAALSINENTDSGTATKIGKNIEIRDANALAPVSVGLNGDTSQITTTGKNLLPMPGVSYIQNGIVFTPNADGSVTLNGKNNGNGNSAYYFVNYGTTGVSMTIPAGTYTVSGVTGSQTITFYDGTTYYDRSAASPSMTFNSSKTFTNVYLQVRRGDTTQFDNYKIYPMLEAGSTATTFEPYTGGKAAPSPDWQIPVSTVTGEQTITISDGGSNSRELKVNLGKNLFNTLDQTGIYRTTVVSKTDNSLVLKPEASGVCYVSYSFDAQPKTMYTVSAIAATTGSTSGFLGMFYVQSYNGSSHSYLTNIVWGSVATKKSVTFTTPGDCQKIRIQFYPLDREDSNYQNMQIEFSEIQVEKGSSASSFAPYFEPIELCKLSDGDTVYQDYIYKSGDDWYVHKEFGKINLGSLTWNTEAGGTNYRLVCQTQYTNLQKPASNDSLPIAICSHYGIATASDTYLGVQGLSMSQSNRFYIYDNNYNSSSSGAAYNTWAQTNNPIVYWKLVTATDTEITHQPLIDQLEALASTALYEGQNNITVSGDLAGYLNLTYNTINSGVYVASMVNGAYILDDDTREPAYAKAWIPYDLTYYNDEWYLMNMVGEVYIPDNSISGDKIVNGAITSSKIDWSTMNTGVLGQDVVIGTFLGKPLYCRVIKIERNGSTATGWKQFDMPAGMNIGWVKNAYGFGTNDGTSWFNVNRPRQDNTPYSMSISTVSNSKIDICIGTSMGEYWDYMYICVEYIKSTD